MMPADDPLQTIPFAGPATDPLRGKAEALRRHPAFDAAVLRYTESMIRFRITGPRHFTKLLAHDTRYRIVVLICSLHLHGRARGDDAGVTAPCLLAALNRTLSGSRSILRTTLQMMLKIGLVAETPDPTDRRVRRYVPTDTLMAMNRAWFAVAFDCLDLVWPEARLPARFAADDTLFRRVNLNIGDALLAGETLTGRMPELRCFFSREFGWPFLYQLVQCALSGAPAPSLNTVARTFSAPRAQIAAIRAEARQLGYVVDSTGHHMEATSLLLQHNEAWLTFFFAFLLDLAERPSAWERTVPLGRP